MTRSKDTDAARLYHLCSSNVRARPVEVPSRDEDDRPLRVRRYPDAPYTVLPGRDFDVPAPLGAVLQRRRSVRRFALRPLALDVLGRLVNASFGVTARVREGGADNHLRASPSAGGHYPLELYVATQAVAGLPDGIHHYDARAHELALVREGRQSDALVELTLGQDMVRDANLVFIITAVRERTMFAFGQRGYRFLFLDAGHLGQNLYLVATALGLGPVSVGAFLDAELGELCRLPPGEEPLYLVCVGLPGAPA